MLTVSLFTAACVEPSLAENGANDSFVSRARPTRATCREEARKAIGVLALANEASLTVLDGGVGLSSNAARNIVAYRLGDDETAGTGDDERFDTLAELIRGPVESDGRTNDSGTYVALDLAPGKYTVRAWQQIFVSAYVEVEVTAGACGVEVELPDVGFVVCKEGDNAHESSDRISSPEGEDLVLHWRVRGTEAATVELAHVDLGKAANVDCRTIEEEGDLVGYVVLTIGPEQHRGGTARYEARVTRGGASEPVRTAEIAVGPKKPVSSGARFEFYAEGVSNARDLGFVRVRYLE